MTDGFTDAMREGARAAWAQYIAALEPHREALARYCRRLTGDVWDAEDLAHDAMLRGFGLFGSVWQPLRSPRAYLLRIATNLWIDAQRRRVAEARLLSDASLAGATADPPRQETAAQVRDAGETLMRYLAPQERAAVLLKDVFDMSLDETADMLGTTTGAVKAALHRGRGRLAEVVRASERPVPSTEVIDRFVACYHAQDMKGLVALMLDSASIEMTGVNNEFGREGFDNGAGWVRHTLIGFEDGLRPVLVRWERGAFRGEPLILQFTTIRGCEQLTSLIRLETEGDKVARVRCYTFCPEAVREVAAELGLEAGPVFYSFPPFNAAWAPGGAFRPD